MARRRTQSHSQPHSQHDDQHRKLIEDIARALDLNIDLDHPHLGWPYIYGSRRGWRAYYNGSEGISNGKSFAFAEIMQHFDLLRAPIRRALAEAQHPWAPTWCLKRVLMGYSDEQIISRIAEADARQRREQELELAGLGPLIR